MKKISICIFLMIILVSLPQVAAAGWVPYKLVKRGAIDESRWNIDNSSAVITPDGDRVKFVHQADTAGDSAWLRVNRCPESVKGLRVTIEVGEDVVSRLLGRIGSVPGAYGSDKDALLAGLSFRKQTPEEDDDRVFGFLSAHDIFNDWEWQYDLNYTEFGHPIGDVVGKTFRLTMKCDKQKITFKVDGYGTSTYTLPKSAKTTYDHVWVIGTRSVDATGAGTVYFSDVELLIDGECDTRRPKVKSTYPANDQRKVPVDLEKISVTFNEAMSPYSWSWRTPLSGDTEFQHSKTFVKYNQGQTLESKTWYEVCLDKKGFLDLAGNGNRPYCFSFKTEKAPPNASGISSVLFDSLVLGIDGEVEIQNPGFEEDKAGWSRGQTAGTNCSFTIDPDAYEGSKAAKLTITNDGYCMIRNTTPIQITQTGTYRFDSQAKASGDIDHLTIAIWKSDSQATPPNTLVGYINPNFTGDYDLNQLTVDLSAGDYIRLELGIDNK